jgi:hypothetical protein
MDLYLRSESHRHEAVSGDFVIEEFIRNLASVDSSVHVEERHLLDSSANTNIDDSSLDLSSDDRTSFDS